MTGCGVRPNEPVALTVLAHVALALADVRDDLSLALVHALHLGLGFDSRWSQRICKAWAMGLRPILCPSLVYLKSVARLFAPEPCFQDSLNRV